VSKDGGCACIFLWVFVRQEHTKKRAKDRPNQRPKVLLWARTQRGRGALKKRVDRRGAVNKRGTRGAKRTRRQETRDKRQETRDKRQETRRHSDKTALRQDDSRQEKRREKRG